MARSRASAKKAGTSFETLIVNHLARWVDDRIERRRLSGSNDRGDISGWRYAGHRIVGECKDYGGRIQPGPWLNELATEIGNDDALTGFVIAKKRGTTDPNNQIVLTTLGELIALLTGSRDHLEGNK